MCKNLSLVLAGFGAGRSQFEGRSNIGANTQRPFFVCLCNSDAMGKEQIRIHENLAAT